MVDHSEPVVTDGLRIVGAFAATGHPGVSMLESAFLRQHVTYPEHVSVVHWRWSYILEAVPQMRSRHLYDDLSDIYREAEKQRAGKELYAAYDLTILQQRFWTILRENQMTLAHVYGWQFCAAQAWQRRLLARVNAQKPWRRSGHHGKIKKPMLAPPSLGKWFN